MAIAANEGWTCETIDIKATFLQGKKLEGVIRKLEKAAYGLDDASRNWYFSVRDELLKLKCKQSSLDKAVFQWTNHGKLEGIFVMHVDDFLYAGTKEFKRHVIDKIIQKYKVGRQINGSFRYVGLKIAQAKDNITIDQSEYIAEMEEIPVSPERKNDKCAPLTEYEREKLCSVGGLFLPPWSDQLGSYPNSTRHEL